MNAEPVDVQRRSLRDSISMEWIMRRGGRGLVLELTVLVSLGVALLAPSVSSAAAPLGQLSVFTPSIGRAPSSIVTGPDGNLWFTEASTTSTTPFPDGRMPHGAIGRITPTGQITEFATPGQAQAITVGPDGNLWFTEINDPVPHTIQSDVAVNKITTAGVITEFRYGNAGFAPDAITSGPDGNLWVADGHLIDRVTTSGSIQHFCITPNGTGFLSGHGIVTGPDGNIWFTTNNGAVWKTSTTGMGPSTCGFQHLNDQEFALGLPAPYQPFGLTVGPDHALWFGLFTGGAAPGLVGRLTTGGSSSTFPFAPGTSSVYIAAGPDGALWFTDPGTSVYRMTTSGSYTRFPLTPRFAPFALNPGPDGNIWLVDNAAHVGLLGTAPIRVPHISDASLASRAFKAKRGTTLRLTLSAAATVDVVIKRVTRGHRHRGICRPHAKHGKRCTIIKKVKMLRFTGRAGAHRFKLAVKGLKAGSYVAGVTATNTAGTSNSVVLRFVIKP